MPCEQTPQQLTPGPSGTQWSEVSFHEPPNTMSHLFQAQVNPSTCQPETEVAPTQSMEEPFACPTTPASIIIIDNTPVGSSTPTLEIPPIALNPTMRLGRNLRTCNQPS
ncbi:hypothetical protein O181_080663 [Austropuccinia psidii MF-1]|uniref:Uncharacterized protein n=1 Tax=Austropuccinia psidii MF-1 TaxID=1389203 RepID=A0A9Q3FJ26_9BASI|nr:hypothetical protein [Austropuccinia psidii MF-1]